MTTADLFLFHELRVWAVVHDIGTEHRRSQRTVYLLCIDILELPVKDEVVAFHAQANRGLLAKQDECEDITILHNIVRLFAVILQALLAYLLATAEEEFVRIHAIDDGAPKNGEQVEDYGRFVWVPEQQLS